MHLKQAVADLRQLAVAASRIDGSLDEACRLMAAAMRLSEMSPEEVSDDEDPAEAVFTAGLEKLPKTGRAWWLPPHNFIVNQTLLGGYNFWRFTILPFFPKKKAYSESLAGIVIHPAWVSVSDRTYEGTQDFADRVVAAAQKAPTVQDAARAELAWIEREFSIRIPESVQSGIIKDALPTARRRWGVDRLRIKDRLVPLDGSAPRDLGNWGPR